MMKVFDRKALKFFFPFAIATYCARNVSANPTQDEVFRSINQNVGSTVDLEKLIPFVMMGIALVLMLALYNYYRKRKVVAKPLHNSNKLTRQLAQALNLTSAEMRQLKQLAAAQEVENPLTLLLCPSVLGKAMKTDPTAFERETMAGLVQRLRGKSNVGSSH
jgi:hypothetical protein